MKTIKVFFLLVFSFLMVAVSDVQAQTPKKKWSNKAKGATVGAGAGAVGGAIVGGGKGAVIGAGVGAVGGGLLGRKKDKKKDPARYELYRNKNKQ